MHNVDIEAPRWIAGYEALADSLMDGFDMCIYEYTSDMSCRELLHQYSDHPNVREYEMRIAIADRKLKAILKPTNRCIHGDYPESHFWFWTYPPNSPELENDLREMGAI
jgi:heterodisulfide reductase subunit B